MGVESTNDGSSQRSDGSARLHIHISATARSLPLYAAVSRQIPYPDPHATISCVECALSRTTDGHSKEA